MLVFSLNASFEEQKTDRTGSISRVRTLWNRERGWNVKPDGRDSRSDSALDFSDAVSPHSDFTYGSK